jgi:ATP-dependent exoDNAse (exonuclease V) beta subunit
VEAERIADIIENLLQKKVPIWDKKLEKHRAITPEDIAILSRSWWPLEIYSQALNVNLNALDQNVTLATSDHELTPLDGFIPQFLKKTENI